MLSIVGLNESMNDVRALAPILVLLGVQTNVIREGTNSFTPFFSFFESSFKIKLLLMFL